MKNNYAPCGLDCAICPAFIALKNNDQSLREKTVIEWTQKYDYPFTPEMINCTGCATKKEPHCGYCSMCEIRRCSYEKQVKNCVSCTSFKQCSICKAFEEQSGKSILELSRETWLSK